jgi:hypothetical protein
MIQGIMFFCSKIGELFSIVKGLVRTKITALHESAAQPLKPLLHTCYVYIVRIYCITGKMKLGLNRLPQSQNNYIKFCMFRKPCLMHE